MVAYEDMLNATSTPEAPWFAIPADDKPFMRLAVAEIICSALRDLDPQYPALPKAEQGQIPLYTKRIKSSLATL